MAAAPETIHESRAARDPFRFKSASHIIRIERAEASTLAEFSEQLKTCPDASIFHHTFQTLGEHHFIREGFSNDFAHWAFAACNEVGLAERLAAIDVRDFTEIAALRERIVSAITSYLAENPSSAKRTAFEPFYFCASEVTVTPTPFSASTLPEFAECLQRVSLHSIHYHFILARLRLKLDSNDFSLWLSDELGLGPLAAFLSRIDIYTSSLNDIRQQMCRLVKREIARRHR